MRRRPAAVTFAALAAAGVLLLAGCGSSAPTKAQYAAKADAICRTASGKTTPLIGQVISAAQSLSSSGGQSAARQLSNDLQQLHATAAGALTKLRALSQPAGGHAAIERFLTPFGSVTDTLGKAASAAAGGQPQKALGELEEIAPDAQQMTSAATAYGLTDCENMLATPAIIGLTHPVHATLVGENHTPTVNQPWTYTVTVTGAQDQKLSGTETTNYTYNGVVVGTEKPENVKFTAGVYHDTIEFPAAAVGHPLAVQVVVHTSLGSVTLTWSIEVKR
jgi:hypothetical protein